MGALLLYKDARAMHCKAYGLLRGHAIDIFRDYVALRVFDGCAEAVSKSPISYPIEFLLQALEVKIGNSTSLEYLGN